MLSRQGRPPEALYAVAESQQGYFTTAQAREAGFQDSTHPYHVRSGDWIREWRGIYRLAYFPQQPEGEWVVWSLWSRDRDGKAQGVYSHQTALSLYDLSDLMPSKIHLTVPKAFRRSAAPPKVLVVHRGGVPKADREVRKGFVMTKPLKTLLDLLDEGEVPEAILAQAGREALKRGLITKMELKRRKTTPEQKRFLLALGKTNNG